MIHTQDQFRKIVDALNTIFSGSMTFQLAGSLAHKPASFHDADIIVYPSLPVTDVTLEAFARGCRDAGNEVLAIDKTSTVPFPGRPHGQDRVQVKFQTGQIVDMFFPKAMTPSR
jgi:hypothetical protein